MARVLWGLIFLLGLVVSLPSLATSCPSYDDAKAQCVATTTASPEWKCNNPVPSPSGIGTFYATRVNQGDGGAWGFSCGAGWMPPTDRDICLAKSSYAASFGANISVCRGGCTFSPEASAEVWTVKGVDGGVRSGGAGQYSPTGGICNGGPNVEQPPPVVDPPRKLCGGGSCYDSAAKQFCAVNASGVQVCIPAPAPQAAGGCISGGDTTLCVGSPPPLPPNPPVVDPSSQIASSDKYSKQVGDQPGAVSTVNNYNQTGSQPKSGAAPSDNTPPASSSSAPAPAKDGTSASGGGDCNTPPICEGAAATCMVVTQTYLLRCPGRTGAGPGEGDGDVTVPGLGDVGEAPGPGFMREETLLDKLDQSGFGSRGQCPKLLTIDLDKYGVHFDTDSLPWCSILEKAGYLLLFLAAFVSYRILSEK